MKRLRGNSTGSNRTRGLIWRKVTAQELEASLAQQQSEELSDDDLIEVAAGRGIFGTPKKRSLVYRPGQDKGRVTSLPYNGGSVKGTRLPFVTSTSEIDDGDGPVMI